MPCKGIWHAQQFRAAGCACTGSGCPQRIALAGPEFHFCADASRRRLLWIALRCKWLCAVCDMVSLGEEMLHLHRLWVSQRIALANHELSIELAVR